MGGRWRLLRKPSQVFGLLIVNLYLSVLFRKKLYTGPLKGICVPFLYCHSCPTTTFACPIGTLQHYSAIHQIPFFLLGHLMILGLLVGRMACGWLCPVGLLQELIGRIKSRTVEIPRFFTALPYFNLMVLAVLLPFLTTEHWFSKLCPVGTLVAGIPWVVWNPVDPQTGDPTIVPGSVGILFLVKIAILVGFLVLFVVAKRPFCRYACPLGVFWSFFNKLSLLRLEVSPECTKCGACKNSCPAGLLVYEDPNSRHCLRCLECTKCKHVGVVCSLTPNNEGVGMALEGAGGPTSSSSQRGETV